MAEVSWNFEGVEYTPEYSAERSTDIYCFLHVAKVGGGTLGRNYPPHEKWAVLVEVHGEIVFSGGFESPTRASHEQVVSQVYTAMEAEEQYAPIFENHTRAKHVIISSAFAGKMKCIYCDGYWLKDPDVDPYGKCPGIRNVVHGDAEAAAHSCKTFDARGICCHTLHCCVCDLCIGKIPTPPKIEINSQYGKGTVSAAKINEDGTHGPFEVIGEGTVTYDDLDDEGNSGTMQAEEIAAFNKKIIEDFMAGTAPTPAAKSVWAGNWTDAEKPMPAPPTLVKGTYKCTFCHEVRVDPVPTYDCPENNRLGQGGDHNWMMQSPENEPVLVYNQCTNCNAMTPSPIDTLGKTVCPVADQNGPHNWVPVYNTDITDDDIPF